MLSRGRAGRGVSRSNERTNSTVKESEGQQMLRVAEQVFFRLIFTAGGACATQATGGVRAESNLDKN